MNCLAICKSIEISPPIYFCDNYTLCTSLRVFVYVCWWWGFPLAQKYTVMCSRFWKKIKKSQMNKSSRTSSTKNFNTHCLDLWKRFIKKLENCKNDVGQFGKKSKKIPEFQLWQRQKVPFTTCLINEKFSKCISFFNLTSNC